MTRFDRPPLNGNPPAPAGPPIAVGAGQECAMLPQLRAAYYAVLSGSQTAQIRDGERWQTFSKPDAKTLQIEIRRLETMCEENSRHGRAIRAGGIRKHPYGYGWGNGYGSW